jgi:transposase
MDTVDNAITKPVHRLEVFTGAGRRRTWSDKDKARIVAEIVASGESVSAVARRHGLSPQQLFGWRRGLQASQTALSHAEELQFVPAVLDVAPTCPSVRRQRKMPRRQVEPGAGMIEVEIDGVTVRVGSGVDVQTVTAVLRALKGGT